MSTNPDEAVGMADEPPQSQSRREGTAAGRESTTAAESTGAGGAPDAETGAGLGAGEPNTFEPEEASES
jgi:hypothetical protein